MKILLILSLLSTFTLADAPADLAKTASFAELSQLLKNLPPESKKEEWYGSLDDNDKNGGACGFGVKNKSGVVMPEGLALFVGDFNNDHEEEYVLVSRCGGSLRTDTLLNVYKKKGKKFVSLKFDSLLDKNGLDGSKIPLNIGKPFLTKENDKMVIHFANPAESWLWQGDSFTKLKSTEAKTK